MSLTINIYYTGENGNARKFAEEMVEKGVVDRVRAEKANGGEWLEGHRFRSNPSDSDITSWTDSLK